MMPREPRLLARVPNLAFVDSDRAVWSVFDCRLAGGKLVVVTTGSPTADARVFQSENGSRLIYQFARAEARGSEPGTLSAQRRMAVPLRGW